MKKDSFIRNRQIGIKRFRYVYYKDRPISHGRLNKLGYSTCDLYDMKHEQGHAYWPKGTFGGPCPTKEDAIETIDFLVHLGLRRNGLSITNRYRVMDNDSIRPDSIPVPYKGEEDYVQKSHGYKSFSAAYNAAKIRYEQITKWLRDDKGKPLQPISILIEDTDGKTLIKQNNGYKTKK